MEKNLQKLLIAALLVLLAVFSFLFLGDRASTPATHASTVAVIDEKTEDVLKLTASASLASFGVSAIPGDTATPIAGKLADFSEYFLLILTVLYAEKFLITIIGAGVFRILIPCACVLAIISLYRHPVLFRRLALRLTAVGLALYLLIPLTDVALAMLAALCVGGSFTRVSMEVPALILFILQVAGFSNLLRLVLRRGDFMASSIPILICACLFLTPVFVDLAILEPVQMLLPPYLYLKSIHGNLPLWYMAVYALCAGAVSILLDKT